MKDVAHEVTEKWFRSLVSRSPRLRAIVITLTIVGTCVVTPAIAVSGVFACSRVDCTPWSRANTAEPRPSCSYDWPPQDWHIHEKVIGRMHCGDKVPLPTDRTFILVDPPFVNGAPLSRSAVYRLHSQADGSLFAEIVAGTPNPDDDYLTFVACIVVVTEQSAASIESYLASNDRSGIPVRPAVQWELDCRRLIHDPTIVDRP